MFKIRIKKKTKKAFKIIILVILTIILLLGILALIFKPTYEVTYKGKFVGYTKSLRKIDEEIEKELKKGGEGITYYDLEEPIGYTLTFMKKGTKLNDNMIDLIKESALPVYRYYVVTLNGEERGYFKKYSQAEELIEILKQNESANVEDLDITISYKRKEEEYSDMQKLADEMYEKKKEIKRSSKQSTGISYKGISYKREQMPLEISPPITGPITSTFQPNRTVFGRTSPHSGIDIGRSIGTPVKAAQSGFVVVSGFHGAYGNFICIDHTSEMVTGYGHLSKRLVKIGDYVEKGQVIGLVGSTGRSTGPHLHFEVRLNGIAYNPKYYVSFN